MQTLYQHVYGRQVVHVHQIQLSQPRPECSWIAPESQSHVVFQTHCTLFRHILIYMDSYCVCDMSALSMTRRETKQVVILFSQTVPLVDGLTAALTVVSGTAALGKTRQDLIRSGSPP